jgi:hypothetical protein
MTMNGPSQSSSADGSSDFSVALQTVRPQLSAITEADYAPLNVDITASCTAILVRVPKILSLRAQVVLELPVFDISHFDTLEVKTQAAIQTQFNHLLASAAPGEIPEYDAKLNRYRTLFLSDINTLAMRGMIDNSKLGDLKSPNGYKNLAESVSALASHIRRNWSTIQSRAAVTQEELADAEETAVKMLLAVANQATPLAPTQAAVERRQAYTLFIRSYDEVRRVVTYLRTPFDDVEEYAPSVRSVVKVERAEPKVEAAKEQGAQPAAGTTPVNFAPVPAPAAAAAGPLTRPGLPNSSPIGEG